MRTFSVSSVTPVNARATAWNVGWDTKVILESPPPSPPKIKPVQKISPYTLVGGLDKQIQEIRDLIELPLSRPDLYHQFGLKPPRGILLHGPPGTGKTHLARVIADASGASLITVSGPELSSALHGETESKLRAVFEEARALSPSIVVLDEVDAICPKREDSGAGVEARVVTTLLTLMDGMDLARELTGETSSLLRVVVVATTNRPNAIDPALRRPGRFDREIEIGVPDVRARLSILNVLLTKIPHSILPDELQNVAMRSHGHVGADLAAVVREAGSRAIKRWTLQGDQSNSAPCLTYVDLLDSISSIRPSALRELFVESPSVRWSDIGGQTLVKQKLKESVEWPLLHWQSFARLGVTPPKGVLLYGPPGCSKTLTAKALATESGINFISVKGPELLNKYVGESERAVRDIFRKARGAAPSIIFFDEIDALATSRSDGETSSHQGVLTTLLTEMDGIQDLVGVIVVAATNRPDVLDPAMMRPGRLDRILYVGPPDLESRREILRIRTSKMAVDPDLSIEDLAWMTEGCSGAEIAAMCQEAALRTMKQDIESSFVSQDDFVYAAKNIRRQITRTMISKFEKWRDSSGVPVV
ncbi:hypothetical protein BS47DRAFT_1314561 [Hydnum rufescens UP504]|uniref:AAA+ ATPase domain-containing protein n=1 Tax=Hydnum rufescens UP504 TaxID=1448309 RepID=A0A9P6DZZ9_9AGAM|nr:hypothetical protein BS47DRAFT_1314561 [Hydnum rufescens UP504]